jgi:hypothetical protein
VGSVNVADVNVCPVLSVAWKTTCPSCGAAIELDHSEPAALLRGSHTQPWFSLTLTTTVVIGLPDVT